jgi:hypothetical protein
VLSRARQQFVLPNPIDHARFVRMSHTFALRLDYLAQRCRKWEVPFDAVAARNRSPWLLECRLVTTKLALANDPSRAPISNLLYQGLKAYIGDKGPIVVRIVRALRFVSVALRPRRFASWLIAFRFLVVQRPRWFALLFAKLSKVKTSSWHGSPRTQETDPRADWNR